MATAETLPLDELVVAVNLKAPANEFYLGTAADFLHHVHFHISHGERHEDETTEAAPARGDLPPTSGVVVDVFTVDGEPLEFQISTEWTTLSLMRTGRRPESTERLSNQVHAIVDKYRTQIGRAYEEVGGIPPALPTSLTPWPKAAQELSELLRDDEVQPFHCAGFLHNWLVHGGRC